MAKEIYFFLTKEELIKVFQEVEHTYDIKYIRSKEYNSRKLQEFSFIKEIDGLGVNKSGNHQTESFLVVEKRYTVVVRSVVQTNGSVSYYLDQMNNENSIVFWPSGIYGNKFFVCGHVGANNNETSSKLFSCVKKKIMKQCDEKVGRYYIGKEAKNLYNIHRFITINISQPEEYDIKL